MTDAAPPVPPAPPVPAPPSAPATRAGWGPPGKIRSWVAVALLSIITCGIYFMFWQYYVFPTTRSTRARASAVWSA